MATQAPARGTRNPNHTVRVEPTPKWVRAVKAGEVVADTKRALIMFETGHTPVYYIPLEDIRMGEFFEPTDHSTHCPYKGDATYWTMKVRDTVEENALWSYPTPLDPEVPVLSGYAAFYWNKMDAWFEENEQVYVHARDPYKRVDVLPSTRHVKVVVDGETIAETHNPVLLFETGLPVRYYIPKLDVNLRSLEPTEKVTRCPYKGEANYYSVNTASGIEEDLVWYYTYPTVESSGIKGTVCFFNERCDVYVDGELQERPQTKWSK